MRVSKIFVTVDAVVVKKIGKDALILLVKRKNEPYRGSWALPGGFVDENEDLPVAAARELREETGIVLPNLVQLKAFGKPGRDPRQHTVAVAFLGYADEHVSAVAADDAEEAKWFPLDDLPALAFDHDEIIEFAKEKISL
jgi:8-oxo-dGTP diphosphatase